MTGLVKRAIKATLPAPVWERFRARWWRYVRPLIVDYYPMAMPWFPAVTCKDASGSLHRLAFRFYWHDQWSATTFAALIIASMTWPFRATYGIGSQLAQYGVRIRAANGIGLWMQAAGMIKLAFWQNIPPACYYKYRLFKAENARRGRHYIAESQMSVLYPILAENLPSDAPLRNKRQFLEQCRSLHLPTADAVAVFEGGSETWYAGDMERLPSTDLVLKPVDLACGRGFELWKYDVDGQRWRHGECELDAVALIEHCRSSGRSRGYILQARLRSHPALAKLSGDGLCTIRIVTYRRRNGAAGVLLACLRMPTSGSHVDNFEAGGLAASIDLETGRLGTARTKDPCRGEFTSHPDSMAAIAGQTVPYFKEAIDLALRAHASFDWAPFVGWDVVVSSHGPLLLEANPDWCVELAQIASGRPLGETIYPEVFLEHLSSRELSLSLQGIPLESTASPRQCTPAGVT
jgi:hypothetical protein